MRTATAEAGAMRFPPDIPPDPDSIMEVQSTVFADEITNSEKENGPMNIMTFIVENAPLFRYFANHLSSELREDWEKALKDKHSLRKIEEEFANFRNEVEKILSDMDPELFTELTAATERGDVDEASRIFETHFQQHGRENE